MDVGTELRQAREQRALSLEEVSRRTKIGLGSLRAIENNEVGRLPGGIFTRGFLKAYAREVGLDPADVCRRYLAQFEPVVVPQPVESAPPAPAAADIQHPHDARRASAPTVFGRIGPTIAIAVLVAVAYLEFSGHHRSGQPFQNEGSPAVGLVEATGGSQARKNAAVRAETATTGSLGTVPPAVASDLALHVELHPLQSCWVSATADGRRVIYRLMLAGERQTIEAHDELVLRVGDAARFAFSINGTSGAPLGPAGEPATVHITPRNYRKFVGQ